MAVPGLYVEQMPYPCYRQDRFTGAMLFVLPLAMIFAWLFPIAMTIRGIVREKEVSARNALFNSNTSLPYLLPSFHFHPCQTRLREFMKMMGLSDAALRLSWFLTSGAILLLSVASITLLLKAGNILVYSNWWLVVLYLFMYAVSMIAYRLVVAYHHGNHWVCCVHLPLITHFPSLLTQIGRAHV